MQKLLPAGIRNVAIAAIGSKPVKPIVLTPHRSILDKHSGQIGEIGLDLKSSTVWPAVKKINK